MMAHLLSYQRHLFQTGSHSVQPLTHGSSFLYLPGGCWDQRCALHYTRHKYMVTLASPLPVWCADQRLSNAGGRDRNALWFLGLLGMSVRLPYGCEQAPGRNNLKTLLCLQKLLCLVFSETLQYIVLGSTDFRSEVRQHNMTAGEHDRGCTQDKRLPIDVTSVLTSSSEFTSTVSIISKNGAIFWGPTLQSVSLLALDIQAQHLSYSSVHLGGSCSFQRLFLPPFTGFYPMHTYLGIQSKTQGNAYINFWSSFSAWLPPLSISFS